MAGVVHDEGICACVMMIHTLLDFEFEYDDESDVLEATTDGITGDNNVKSSCVHKEVLPCFSGVSGITMMMLPLLMMILIMIMIVLMMKILCVNNKKENKTK